MCLGDGLAGRARRSLAFGLPDEPSAARSERGPIASGRGERLDAHPPSSVRRGPDSARNRAFFISEFNRPAHRHRPAIDGSHHRSRWTLFNKLPQDELGTGRRFVLHLCGCSSAGRARPRHGRGHEFEARHPLHFGCVHALRGHTTWCWWPEMCATFGQVTCSETPHPTGCSRLGTAEVEAQMPSWLSRQSGRLVSGRPRVRTVAEGTRHVAFV